MFKCIILQYNLLKKKYQKLNCIKLKNIKESNNVQNNVQTTPLNNK